MKSMCPPRTAFNRRFLFSALPNRRRRHPTALRERRGEKKYYIYIKKKKEYWAPSWLPSGTRERVELFRKEINKRRKRLATLLRCRRIEWLGRYRRHMARHSTRRQKKNSSNGAAVRASLRAAGNEDSNIIPLHLGSSQIEFNLTPIQLRRRSRISTTKQQHTWRWIH